MAAWVWHPAEPRDFPTERLLPCGANLSKSFVCHQHPRLAAQRNHHPLVPRTVLLLNRSEVQSEFLSIAEKLSTSEHPQRTTLVLLLEHLYQASFGTRCDLESLHHLLKVGSGSFRFGDATMLLGTVSYSWLVDFMIEIIFD